MHPQFSYNEISTLKRMMSQYYENQCSFSTGIGSSAWGSISGNIGDQTDLSVALGAIDDDISTINTTLGTLSTSVNGKMPLTGTSAMSGSFLPATTNVSDFGDNTFRFRGGYFQNVYASGKMFVGPITSSAYTGLTVDVGLTSFLGGTTTVSGSILPNVGSIAIGNTSSAWSGVYSTFTDNPYGSLTLRAQGFSRATIGNASAPALNLTHTSQEQLRLSYDANDYLSVTVNSTGSTTFSGTGTNVGYLFNNSGSGAFIITGGNGLGVSNITTHGPANMNLTVYGANYLRGIINGFEAFRFHPSGNLSIKNTTDSNFPLDVTGDARATRFFIGTNVNNYIANGGVNEVHINSANCDLRIGGTYAAVYAWNDNTKDLGGTDKRWRNGYFGTGITVGGTSAPTHAVTLPTASTGIAIHNQADQTTNFEVGRLYWTSNKLRLSAESAGTGTVRGLLFTSSLMEFQVGGSIWASIGGNGSIGGVVNIGSGATTGLAGASRLGINPTFNASSGLQYLMSETPTINQTGSAGYVGYYASIYEQAVASGPKLLMDLGINSAANGGGTHTSRAKIDNTGKTTIADDFVNETVGKGWVTRSPDGTYYRITVNNGGTTLIITAI